MVAALQPLQALVIKSLPYLKDWLICTPSQSQVVLDMAHLLSHVARLSLYQIERHVLVWSDNMSTVSQINHQ